MSWPEVIGIFVGIAIVVGPLAKWLISDWFEKAKKIEQMKAAQTQSAIKQLEEEIKSFTFTAGELKRKMKILEQAVHAHKGSNSELQAYVENAVVEMKTFSTRLNDVVKAVVKTEILELSKRAKMIKDKKNGKS